jgi:cytochrome c-type biogenesis protein
MNATIAFAFGAGLLATVNPCGFAMLPGFLDFYVGADDDAMEHQAALSRAAHGFIIGVVLSASFGAVFVFAGLIVSAGLRSFVQLVPWLAVAIGAALLVLGATMLAGRHVTLTPASRINIDGRATRGYSRVAIFGATYALVSLSCTLAVFLAVVGQALATTNIVQLFAVFAGFVAGSASLLIALSLGAALAKGALARAMHRLRPVVNRLSGALLMGSGTYLILYWLPTIGNTNAATNDSWAATATRTLSSTVTTFFAAHTTQFAGLLALLTALGTGLLAHPAEASRSDGHELSREHRRSPRGRAQ